MHASTDDEKNKGHYAPPCMRQREVRICMISFVISVILIQLFRFIVNSDDIAGQSYAMYPPATDGYPDVDKLIQRLDEAMAPFETKYLVSLDATGIASVPGCEKGFSDPVLDHTLEDCLDDNCEALHTLEEAKARCVSKPECGGVTYREDSGYEVRRSSKPLKSDNGETCWVRKNCLRETPTALDIWQAFSKTMDAALNDAALYLNHGFGDPVWQDTIFVAVSSFRDTSCPATIGRMFQNAERPERLSVGIVQQNCVKNCVHGVGWGDTRHMKPGIPEPDCVEVFCQTRKGRVACEEGRVRILRLGESSAFGPLFAHYLNAQLWRGEEYYLQVDAHSDFREGWDTTLKDMIKLTPSYPNSVISNFPPEGDVSQTWHQHLRWRRRGWGGHEYEEDLTGPLCNGQFAAAISSDPSSVMVDVVAAESSGGDLPKDGVVRVPKHSAFVAAGFLFAHASFLSHVPPDPFLPFTFRGEDLALTVRLWTAGFDIYSPSIDVLKHDYSKRETKFWETIQIVFNTDIHDELTVLVNRRIQNLLGYPGLLDKPVEPADLLTRSLEYGLGNKRSLHDFLNFVGLDVLSRRQEPPLWCTAGTAPPWMQNLQRTPLASKVDSDDLHL